MQSRHRPRAGARARSYLHALPTQRLVDDEGSVKWCYERVIVPRLQAHLVSTNEHHTRAATDVVTSVRHRLDQKDLPTQAVVVYPLRHDRRKARLMVHHASTAWQMHLGQRSVRGARRCVEMGHDSHPATHVLLRVRARRVRHVTRSQRVPCMQRRAPPTPNQIDSARRCVRDHVEPPLRGTHVLSVIHPEHRGP